MERDKLHFITINVMMSHVASFRLMYYVWLLDPCYSPIKLALGSVYHLFSFFFVNKTRDKVKNVTQSFEYFSGKHFFIKYTGSNSLDQHALKGFSVQVLD